MDDASKEKEQIALAKFVSANPYAYLTHEKVRILFGFGAESMRTLVSLGPPIVANKINPGVFAAWLSENRDRIGKLTA